MRVQHKSKSASDPKPSKSTKLPVTAARQNGQLDGRVAPHGLARGGKRHQLVLFAVDDQRGHG